MYNEKISATQLFALIVLFELGSAVVVGVGLKAKQDVWLVIVLGTTAGILLFLLYEYLSKMNPGLTLIGILNSAFGKIIGTILSILYIVYFIYTAARTLRTFGDQIITTILYQTPLLAVNLMLISALVIGCYLGLEVIGRMVEIYFPWVIGFGGLMLSFIFITGLPKVTNIQPMFAKGFSPVLQALFPEVITFPFGEVLVFLMMFSQVNTPEKTKKTGILAILFSGFLILVINMTIIAVLGGEGTEKFALPLVEALTKVNIANFIQRLDALAIIILIFCGYFKIILYMWAAIQGLSEISRREISSKLALPIGIVTLIVSLVMTDNTVEHKFAAVHIVPYIHLSFQIGVPVFLLVIVFIKSKMRKSQILPVGK